MRQSYYWPKPSRSPSSDHQRSQLLDRLATTRALANRVPFIIPRDVETVWNVASATCAHQERKNVVRKTSLPRSVRCTAGSSGFRLESYFVACMTLQGFVLCSSCPKAVGESRCIHLILFRATQPELRQH